jgi:protein required for attachment to host cells
MVHMNQYCVVVANGARARFFTLEDVDSPETEYGPNLIEKLDLANPEHELNGTEIYSDNNGGNRSKNGQSHAYDDHRDRHSEEQERRFANSIAEQCAKMGKSSNNGIVLVSQKRMLGHLRQAMESKLKGISTQELAKDLSKLSPMELHEHLARENLIPKRQAPTVQ